jgi:hypothetical protein
VLDRLLLKLFKPRFLEQQRELVLRYSEIDGVASFTSDDRPGAARISIDQQLTNLFKGMQACTTTEFIRAAMAKGMTQTQARNYLTDGVAAGSIVYDKGPKNAKYHKFAVFTPDEGGGTVQ